MRSILIGGFFLGLLWAPGAQADGTVRLASGEYPPYLSDSLPHDGLISHIVTSAFATQGVKVKYGYFPWKRTALLVKMGHWDGSPGWLWSEDRAEDYWFSEPVIIGKGVFFFLKDSPAKNFEWQSYADLKGLKVGTTLGYHYGEAFHQAQRDGMIQVSARQTNLDNFLRLLDGKIDLFPLDKCVGLYVLHKNLPGRVDLFGYASKPMNTDEYRVIFPKVKQSSKALLATFNQGLKQLDLDSSIKHFDRYDCL
ncbi:substrate-binding periplasmic protein [Dongshaea marina]|uniref:substrate-binding periplasmic protein n=1 Tax=Dongshaea marina TaxID=2047966 RepID=UPI000D3EC3E5|nr:transporter substrate-binding domain-containing protein [Dongshaea marina]